MSTNSNAWRLFKLSTLLLVFLSSCNPPVPELGNFNRENWLKGKNGCSTNRQELGKELMEKRELLLAQPESGIISAIGRPDLIELYKRNQKLFYYFVSPGPSCPGGSETPEAFTVRFNAMGRAKEIFISKAKNNIP